MPESCRGPVVALGGFDGVHLGHRAILGRCLELAQELRAIPAVLTFDPLPAQLIYPDFTYVLTPLSEKAAILAGLGMQLVHALRFGEDTRTMAAADFVADIVVAALRPAALVVGHDHRFGRGGEGDADLLRRILGTCGTLVEVVPEFSLLEAPVRSTRIREHLLLGHVALAAQLLGRPYALSGTIVSGTGTGRRLGFPTLNVQVRELEKLVPADGVYAIRVSPGIHSVSSRPTTGSRGPASMPAVLNIGHRPTFSGEKRTIEVHLIDGAPSVVPESLAIHFIDRIRPERRFSSAAELAAQIALDADRARAILSAVGSGRAAESVSG